MARVFLMLLSALVVAGCAGPGAMFHADARHSGVYDVYGIETLKRLSWRLDTGGAVKSSPALAKGLVIFGSDDGFLYAVDRQSGATRWRFRADASIESSAAATIDTVFFGSRKGVFYALDLKTGQERWRFQTDGAIHSSPVLAGKIVYFGDAKGKRHAIDPATGNERWALDVGGAVYTSTASYDHTIVCRSASG